MNWLKEVRHAVLEKEQTNDDCVVEGWMTPDVGEIPIAPNSRLQVRASRPREPYTEIGI
jgi:hypothetical protein